MSERLHFIGGFEPISSFGEFTRPIRNIRINLSELHLRLELIPEAPEPFIEAPSSDDSEHIKKFFGTEPRRHIVEDKTALVLDFVIGAFVVQEEFFENLLFKEPGTHTNPKISGSKACWPLLEVTRSSWRQALPDFQKGASPEVKHYRAYSMTTQVDILGQLDSGEWIDWR